VAEADNGTAGLELLRSGRLFDLVITDVLMPKQDGSAVILYLETQPDRPKILAISGSDHQA